MNKKQLLIGSVLTLAIVLMGTTAASAAFKDKASRGKNLTSEQKQEMQEKKAEWKDEMEVRQAEMQEIMENGDYEAWKALHEERESNRFNILDVINEGNFDRLVEMHNLKQAGDSEGAKLIAEELGFPEHKGKMFKGMKRGHFRDMEK